MAAAVFVTSWSPPALICAALLVALLWDHVLGELPSRWHPVVWMGAYLDRAGKLAAPGPVEPMLQADYRRFWIGALLWLAGAVVVGAAASLLQQAALHLPGVAAAALLGFLLKPMLAWRMLREEVWSVEQALSQSLAAGRERLGWLVSRDVARLTQSGVRESAIESLAENLNDSVVAPIFWFVLFGLPGAAIYRFGNTADAMWGYPGVYQGRDWQWAGKWAARADDVLSWLPARLTALLLLIAAGMPGVHAARRLRGEARQTPSPNSGWPMSAMALVLGVRLSKPGVYDLNAAGIEARESDTARAIRIASMALIVCVAVIVMLCLGTLPCAPWSACGIWFRGFAP